LWERRGGVFGSLLTRSMEGAKGHVKAPSDLPQRLADLLCVGRGHPGLSGLRMSEEAAFFILTN
jgi:hypothetical protein